MAIYTKKGDTGETSLYDKDSRQNIRISKNSLRIKTIGSIDEVNSFLGIIISESPKLLELKEVQKNLFSIGAILAGAPLRFPVSKTKKLESRIDKIEGKLPVLKNFILPSGTSAAAKLFFARTLVRRAERSLVALNIKEPVKPQIMVFINRLSDYLFMLAREINHQSGIKEESWRGRRK